MTITPEIPATALPCMQCQYDLRATPATARCPECGMTVAATLAHQRGELFEPRRVLRLVGAFLCRTVALLMLAMLVIVQLLHPEPYRDNDTVLTVVNLVLTIGGVLFILLGNGLLSHSLFAPDPNYKRIVWLQILRLTYLLIIPLFIALDIEHKVVCAFTPHIERSYLSNLSMVVVILLLETPMLWIMIGYLLLIAWRLRDLARTAPALQPTPRQRLVIRYSTITLVLLIITQSYVTMRADNPLSFSVEAVCLLLLSILFWLQFRRTYAFYRHCKTQWTASLPPKSEPHP